MSRATYHRRLMANLINVERATVGYGTRTLLDGISLGVDDGDAIGVVGRNGDGKTLFDWFTRTRTIRRAIVDIGQDVPSFGRLPFQVYVPPPKKRKGAKKKKSVKAKAQSKKSVPRKVARKTKRR